MSNCFFEKRMLLSHTEDCFVYLTHQLQTGGSGWGNDGTIELIHEILRDMTRKKAGRNESPSLALIDSQSVKTTRSGGLCR
ncbi:MAG: hypothetical protein KKF98_16795, partial [Bacteroidetes bacterium]|nr:hypothetical protein [Bacteroidota bacterium]